MNYDSPYLKTTNGLDSHFKLHEFSNSEGLAMVCQELVNNLEAVRYDLNELFDGVVRIKITDGTRTEADNCKLAERYGWIGEGGSVSKNSQHLTKNGCNGVDFYAYDYIEKTPININTVGDIAKKYFDFVKIYLDGHVHADLVEREKI